MRLSAIGYLAVGVGLILVVPISFAGRQPGPGDQPKAKSQDEKGPTSQPKAKATESNSADAERKSRTYDDPKIFSQLSGAKRSALERQYGRRPVRGVSFTGAGAAAQFALVSPLTAAPVIPPANVRVNNPGDDTTEQDTQSETGLVLGSGGILIAAFNDSGSHVGGASRFTGWALSTNGGASFTDRGTLPDNSDGDAGDPVLARSEKTGTIFLSTLSFNTSHKLLIFRSTDNGASFQPPVNGAPGFTSATGEQDKQWIAVDNFSGPGFGNVYMFWRNFAPGGGMTFSKSVDDGQTWGPNGGVKVVNGAGQGAFVAVGKDHTVYLFWYDQSASPAEIRMKKSTDEGATFGDPVTVTKLVATGINGDLGLSPGFRTNTFPQAAADPNDPKRLYVVYNDQAGSASAVDRGDIFVRRSVDAGATWEPPVKLNDDLTRNDQWQPAMAITPDGRRLCVTWYDRRGDQSNNLIERFGVIGSVGAGTVTWGANFRITTEPFPPVLGVDPMVNELYMGDYDQMAANDQFFFTTWGDNRDNSTGHAGKNANVRFARIPVTGVGPGTSGASGQGEPTEEIPLSQVPQFALDALSKAVKDAKDVLPDGVAWTQAFKTGDTITMFRVQGKDKKTGNPVEAETKGVRVIELEVTVPKSRVPGPVANALNAAAPGVQVPTARAIVVGGTVVGYEFEGVEPTTGPGIAKRVEVYLGPDGRVLGQRTYNP